MQSRPKHYQVLRPFRIALLAASLLLFNACAAEPDATSSTTDTTGGQEETTTTGQVTTTTAQEAGPVRGGTLTVGLHTERVSWDPPDGLIDEAGRVVNHGTYGAVASAYKDGTYGPYLAESIESNEDATVWTVTLRSGVTFHDGTPLNAEAYVNHIDRLMAEDSSQAAAFAPLIGSVEIIDDMTVQITLLVARAPFGVTLADSLGNIVSMAATEALGDDFANQPVGAGPYKFVEWVREDRFVAERYEDFFRDDVAWFDQIIYRPIPDDDARAAALRAGDLDIMYTTSASVIQSFRDDPDFQMVEIPFGVDSLYINHAAVPTDDIRIRQAIWHAVDKEALIDLVWGGIGEPTNSAVSPESPWYNPVETPEYDPDAARALVEEYEAETGNSADFDLMTRGTPQDRIWAEALQAQLAEVGINVTIDEGDANTYVTRLIEGDYQASTRIYRGFLDPWFEMTRLHTSDGTLNIARLGTPEMDEMLQIGSSSTDFDERKAAYDRVQEILAENLEGLYIRTSTFAIIMAPDIRGYGSWTLPDGQPGFGQHFTPILVDELWRAEE